MADLKWSEVFLRTRAQVQAQIAATTLNYPGFYVISDAVTSTKIIKVEATSDATLSDAAINLTDGTFGTYDITADTFTAAAPTLQNVTDAGATTTDEIEVMGMRIYGVSADFTTATGRAALSSNTGTKVTGFGYNAANTNSGNDVTAVGYTAAQSNTQAKVTAFGATAGTNNTGINATVFGQAAGTNNTGDYLVAVGRAAGQTNTGDSVTAVGEGAGNGNSFNNVSLFGTNANAAAASQIVLCDGANRLVITTVPVTDGGGNKHLKIEAGAWNGALTTYYAALTTTIP